MAIRRYTAAQLLALRESPLVQKPDSLPAIEQWIEYVYLETADGGREKLRIPHSESHQQRDAAKLYRAGGTTAANEDSPMGSFSTGSHRPGLMHTRSAASRGNGDDISLGPPKTLFPSSSRVPKLADFADRAGSNQAVSDAIPGDEPDGQSRPRFPTERPLNRRIANSDRDGRSNGRERKGFGDSEEPRNDAKGRSDRFGGERESERRNGTGDRHDSRWSSSRDDRRPNGDRPGGWRDREYQRREKDGERKPPAEKDPEWMDEPVEEKDRDLGSRAPRTQEEFQKWKDDMNKRARSGTEGGEAVEPPSEASVTTPPDASKPSGIAPLKIEGLDLGSWGAGGTTDNHSQAAPQAKPTAAKAKVSRFASMFKPAVEDPAPEDTNVQAVANSVAKASAEDQQGFNRVLQMLGSTKLDPTPAPQDPMSPPPRKSSGANGSGARPRSRYTDVFDQKSPERLQSPPQAGFATEKSEPSDRTQHGPAQDLDSIFGGRLPERQSIEQHVPQGQTAGNGISPEPTIPFNALREQQQRPPSGRTTQSSMFELPTRQASTPDINIQNLLAQQRQKSQATSNESQQLLNLLTKDSADHRPASQQAGSGNGGMGSAQFPRWADPQRPPPSSVPMAEPHAPTPRLPQPPGMFEEHLMRNFPPDAPTARPDHPPGGQDMPQRRTSQRSGALPPGFFAEQPLFLQQPQLRRNFRGDGSPQQQAPQQQAPPPPLPQPANRRNNPAFNLPPMQIPMHPPGAGAPPPFHHLDLFTSPGGHGAGAGFAQQPPPQHQPGGSIPPPRHPPGFSALLSPQPRDAPLSAGGFGAQGRPPNALSPSVGAPPGFFGGGQNPPPGFLTPQQQQQQQQQQSLRSPTDGISHGAGPGQGPGSGGMRGNGGPARNFGGYDASAVGMGPRR